MYVFVVLCNDKCGRVGIQHIDTMYEILHIRI